MRSYKTFVAIINLHSRVILGQKCAIASINSENKFKSNFKRRYKQITGSNIKLKEINKNLYRIILTDE